MKRTTNKHLQIPAILGWMKTSLESYNFRHDTALLQLLHFMRFHRLVELCLLPEPSLEAGCVPAAYRRLQTTISSCGIYDILYIYICISIYTVYHILVFVCSINSDYIQSYILLTDNC